MALHVESGHEKDMKLHLRNAYIMGKIANINQLSKLISEAEEVDRLVKYDEILEALVKPLAENLWSV